MLKNHSKLPLRVPETRKIKMLMVSFISGVPRMPKMINIQIGTSSARFWDGSLDPQNKSKWLCLRHSCVLSGTRNAHKSLKLAFSVPKI